MAHAKSNRICKLKSTSKNISEDKIDLAEFEHVHDRVLTKHCVRVNQGLNEGCDYFDQEVRAPMNKKQASIALYKLYGMRMKWIECGVIVNFIDNVRKHKRSPTYTSIHDQKNEKSHTHGDVNPIHLRDHQKRQIDNVVKENPSIMPTAVVTGITKSTSKITKAFMDINCICANIDRTKYRINRSLERLEMPKNTPDVFTAFQTLENNYKGFIQNAQILSSNFFGTFFNLAMVNIVLPFDQSSIVTDVTYKAVPKGYYVCSSVI